MAKQKQELSKEQILAKKEELINKVNESAEEKKMGRISPAKKFLSEISDVIKLALEKNVSYRQLASDINEIYNFKVSEQTIKAFAKNVLEIDTKQKEKPKVNKENNASEKSSDNVSQNNERIKANLKDI